MQLPGDFSALTSVRTLASVPDTVCFRLSCFPAARKFGLITTLLLSPEVSDVSVEVIVNDADAPLPDEWKRALGRRDVEPAELRALIQRLSDLGVWTLGKCIGNMVDGSEFFHEAATIDKEHGIYMLNPQRNPNTAYEEIVQVYSKELLGYALTAPSARKK